MARHGFRKVPEPIRTAIDALDHPDFRIGTRKRILISEIAAENWVHMGLELDPTGIVTAHSPWLPPASGGRFSKWNHAGRTIVRRDLPKIPKDFGWDAPNFGDSSKGTHWVSQTRMVYVRERVYGLGVPIIIEVSQDDQDTVLVAFAVDMVFDKNAGFKERDLLFALSLLRENVGSVGILEAGRSLSEWLSEQVVSWEFLPEGTLEETLDRAIRKVGVKPESPEARTLAERLTAVKALQPKSVLVGSSGFQRYLGFQFREDLVVFENVTYGNAVYVMYADWETLSQKSRIELFNDVDARFDRVIHSEGWQRRLENVLRAAGHYRGI